MNSVNMTGMNNMAGGPVGGGMPTMMNNGAAGRQPMPVNDNQRSQLNTYIYEYFLRNEMYDCARSLLNSDQPMNVLKNNEGKMNGDDGANGDSKDEMDSKQPPDLPAPNLPKECPESCFLYEWWCLFWDMFNAQRGKGDGRAVMNYVAHTQAQSRQRQEQQVAMIRGLRPEGMMQNGAYQQMMMRNQANGMHMNNSELRQKAIQNRQNATPQQAQMLAQQKQNQMQRGPSDGNDQQRAQSPASAENAPSPSKRPRLDANTPFNPNQMQNGRGQQAPGMPQQVGTHTNGMEPEPNNLTAQQFQVGPGGNNAQATRAYQAGLAQQQAGQMPLNKMPNQGGPQSQGSPMMPQGADGSNVANFYNPGTDIGGMGRGGPNGGQGGNAAGNHALQDYQMQLMLLEQQNKKRLMMARQEQDNMAMPRADGAPGPAMGPNGQPPFQGTSPGARNSPNPSDQMKRTPHMGPSNIPSPLPDGQTRSPSGMNFNGMGQGNPMDPNMAQKGFYPNMNGMDQNMVAAGMQNGMRPPSSHPGPGFNPMAQQMQMQQQRQQQAAVQQAQQGGQNWNGPGGPMNAQPNQPPQQMGTPRQGAMPPPSAPATGAAVNGRTQPPSPQQGTAAPPTPQQGNKANPKKKAESKDTKAKRPKKGTAQNINAGATPSADVPTDGPTPTPQTPVTPHANKSFAPQNGATQAVANGQPPAPPANTNVGASQQPDALPGFGGLDNSYEYNMGFADPQPGNMDVLQDFDFDSFLHQDGDVDNFSFDTFPMEDGGQIGAD